MNNNYVFTTMKKINNEVEYFDKHALRVIDSLMKRYQIKCNIDFNEVYYKCLNMLDGVIKLITDGSEYTLEYREFTYTKEMYEKGFKVQLLDYVNNSKNLDVYIKGKMSKIYLDLLSKIRKDSWNEGLITNEDGYITEGLISNIFFIKDNEIFTPKISLGLIDGIMRRKIIEKLISIGYKVSCVEIKTSKIMEYDSAFLTNCIFGIMPISNIDNIFFNTNIVKELQKNIKKSTNVV